MTRNTGPIIGRCEYTKEPMRKLMMYDLGKQAERDAVARKKAILAQKILERGQVAAPEIIIR